MFAPTTTWRIIQLKCDEESATDTRIVKACRLMAIWLYAFLTPVPYGGEWSALRANRFNLEERANDTEQPKGLDEPQSRSGRKRIQPLQNVSHPTRISLRISDMENINQYL